MPLSTSELLQRSRRELLDLSTRNRLLAIPAGATSARLIHVHDELSDEVYRLLVTDRKALGFLPGRPSRRSNSEPTPVAVPEELDQETGLPQPDEVVDQATGLARRHVDARLQTVLTSEGLQQRLLGIHRDAQSLVEEQGVNVLYVGLGQLRWVEPAQPDKPRLAPLVLIPVDLQRETAADRFQVRRREEDLEENLSLRAKLKADFNLELPPFPDEEELRPSVYFDAVANAVQGHAGWEVLPNAMALGLFSFAKFLMYRDLDPANWPAPERLVEHPFVKGLLQEGLPETGPLLGDDTNLDELIPANRLDHVVDADSSQALAIESVRRGRSAVVQGPPGTGKSQSIANIIATAVLDGKRVLFVAEKLAALEVVKRRLEREGLGPLGLELHSNKASKRAVVEEIGRTWKLGRPKAGDLEALIPKLEEHRAALQAHAAALHDPVPPSGLTPFSILGHLAALGERGQEAADLALPVAAAWSGDDLEERRRRAAELTTRIREMGLPGQHPWRGVRRAGLLQIDLAPLSAQIRKTAQKLAELKVAAAPLAHALRRPPPASLRDTARLHLIGRQVVTAPSVDRRALCDGVWNAGLGGLRDLVSTGKTFAETASRLAGVVSERTWEKDFDEARTHLAAHGRSWLRFLNGDYRRAMATLRGSLRGETPRTLEGRIDLFDQILTGQRAMRIIRAGTAVGAAAFGSLWQGERSAWPQLEAVLGWVAAQEQAGLDESFRRLFADLEEPSRIAGLLEPLARSLESFRESLTGLAAALDLDTPSAFGVPDFDEVEFPQLERRLALWLERMDALTSWSQYHARAVQARHLALGPWLDRLETGSLPADRAQDAFERAAFSQILREVMVQRPGLASFDGLLHTNLVTAFRTLDRERLALARYRTLLAHHDGMPSTNAALGPAGLVRSEMERKRGHRPVRRLLRDAGSVVQAIKPVFMMSPLSVAQFLEPGAVEFDLLVIDEASQIQPVDAFGALARCRQVVVVGDSRQLPPTRFFTRLTSGEEIEDEPGAAALAAEARDIESILGLCCARGLPQTMLRWHYRSRHHSLIAVSNREFYDNRLCIVPSPHPTVPGLGLHFHPVPDGVFDSGGSGANRIEARTVCRAILEHARRSPHLSLGVAAFSIRQQQAILDELELRRRESPDTEPFFAAHPAEPFFVKNLENVQGDERDVIFISVGYGRDAHGQLAMRFGPLSMDGGERRLNVLISRAKRRCVVFSSIVAEDIDLDRAGGRGVEALKTFLGFAQTGRLEGADGDVDRSLTELEQSVRTAVESLGLPVDPRVGVAGFFIDLAVADPNRPGHYLLGLELDGPHYRATTFTRARDRLRQAVLEDHGWSLHRIWSVDWFQHPADQLRRISEAIERAKSKPARPADAQPPAVATLSNSPGPIEPEREEAVEEEPGLAAFAVPYVEAKFTVPRRRDPHELGGPEWADILLQIVQAEGPVHEDELVTRVRDLWNLGRATARLQDAVARGVRLLVVSQRCVREEEFLAIPGAPVLIRNRARVNSSTLRKAEFLPPAEIRATILALVEAHHGAQRGELPLAVARVFGFRTTGAILRERVDAQVDRLLAEQTLVNDGDMLRLGAR